MAHENSAAFMTHARNFLATFLAEA